MQLTLLLIMVAAPLAAEESAASFLNIPIGAKAAGLGSAFTAVADDASAIYWNPGALAHFQRRHVGLSHAELYGQTRHDFLGYVHPTKLVHLGVGVSYLSQPKIEGRDVSGLETSAFTASDRSFSLHLAKPVGRVGLGFGAKVIQQQIADTTASTFALDFGASYRATQSLSFGLAAMNIGPPLKMGTQSDPLPFSFSAGAAYSVRQLMFSADLRHRVHEQRTGVGVGMQVQAFKGVFLRTGYSASKDPSSAETSYWNLSRFTGGMGLRLSGFMLDYAFVPMEIADTQRLSLGLEF
ncbi:MAG: PorV/PorQ family protein [Spirochaetota bacterium]